MKRGTTLFLKLVIIIIGIPILALCIFGMDWLINNPVDSNYSYMIYPILVGIYASGIPFFIALYMAFRLLSYIDKNKAFSLFSIKALNSIKYCAITISTVYVAIMPFVYFLADKDDAPGIIIIGMVPIFASMIIAAFSAVLQRLLQEAINIKSENEEEKIVC